MHFDSPQQSGSKAFLIRIRRLLALHISLPLRTFLIHLLVALFLGTFWYLLLYGPARLHFTHVNWIYAAGGDVLQHQLGWEWFRQEPWQFPLGKITAYGYPFGTSVTFMDSIPLLAIPFKLFSPLFKPNFQYFGVWELSAVIGQMLAGILILHEFTRSILVKTLGAALLVLSPPMIFRAFYHSSLSAHWILLLATWFILIERKRKLWVGAWIVLFAVAVLINVYYIPMLMVLWLVGIVFRLRREPDHQKQIIKFLGEAGAILLVIFLVGYSTGIFSLGYGSLSVSGYGDFSWNLNGFINPFEYSSNFVKARDVGVDTQFEGFSYLGIGNLLLIPAALYLFSERGDLKRRLPFLLPVAMAALVFTLYSLSNRAFFDTQLLWNIRLSDSILRFLNLFRSSGRFIWPVFYLLVLFGLIVIIQRVRFPIPLLIAIIVLQFIDISPLYLPKQLTDITVYQSPLQSDFWQSAAVTNKHVVILPARRLRPPYEPFAEYALRNHLTLNLGYFARYDEQAFAGYRQAVWENIKAHHPDAQTIYILSDSTYISYAEQNLSNSMFICEVDTFAVLFSADNPLSHDLPEFSSYCTNPRP